MDSRYFRRYKTTKMEGATADCSGADSDCRDRYSAVLLWVMVNG